MVAVVHAVSMNYRRHQEWDGGDSGFMPDDGTIVLDGGSA